MYRNLYHRCLVVITFILITTVLSSCNSYLFYQAPRYDKETLQVIESDPRVLKITYNMPFGRQTAFYIKPQLEPDLPPQRLWVLFGGINAAAFGWYEWFRDIPDQRCGLLLIEYPGYGLCEGVPRQERILISSLIALRTLAAHFKIPVGQLQENMGLLGHSLGSLTMMQFANRVSANHVLLISPITSLATLIKKLYGNFNGAILNIINPESFDNRARLKELLVRPDAPQITIIHGAEDELIPVSMGRELAALGADRIQYIEIPEMGHSGLIAEQLPLIYEIMFNPSAKSPSEN